jgi:predicted nucleic acid-binding protein
MVRLELWCGARGDHEKRVLRDMEKSLPELAIPSAVWTLAFELGRKARGKGRTVPATDVLVLACARHHGVELEHADEHFKLLADL